MEGARQLVHSSIRAFLCAKMPMLRRHAGAPPTYGFYLFAFTLHFPPKKEIGWLPIM
jgi:hypothetical protein